jgi:hypothetical protein
MRIERERNAARGMVSDGVHVVYSQLVKQGAVSTAPRPSCCRIYASSRVIPMWPRTFACGSRSECGGIVSDGAVGLTGQTRCGSYRISLRCPYLRILTCGTNVATHVCVWSTHGMGRDDVRRSGGADWSNRAR